MLRKLPLVVIIQQTAYTIAEQGGLHLPSIKGIETFEEELQGCQVTTVHVQSSQAAEKLKKAIGHYYTIETGEMLNEYTKIDKVGECLAEVLGRVLQPHYHGKLLVCGIGNQDISADALGPEVLYNLPLKFFSENGLQGNFSKVVALNSGRAWNNNISTEEQISGVAGLVGADCILVIDSLITEEPLRLFQTIQISTAGGPTQYLSELKTDWSTMKIPVISLGVPMAVPLSSFSPGQNTGHKLFTSIEVQSVIAAAGHTIAYAVLRVCWPLQSKAECFVLSGLNRNPVPYSFLLEGE